MTETYDRLLDIYERADTAFQNSPTCQSDDCLNSFIEEINTLDHNFDFIESRSLDEQYFGIYGSYWLRPFGYPKIGQIINITYEDSTHNYKVVARGLLTMELEMIH